MAKVGIVIVNWNTGGLLQRCLRSLAALTDAEAGLIDRIVVVDNASSDNSLVKAEVVVGQARGRLRVQFLRMEKNVGFAAANNRGIAWLAQHAHKQPHYLLLNPDTELGAGALREMLGAFGRHPKAGIVGPKLLHTDGSLQQSVRSFPDFRTLLLFMLKLGWFWERYLRIQFDYEREQYVDQVMGAAFLIRNSLIAVLPRLDERYFLWFEEVDFCKRARLKGFRTLYTPRAEVVHHGGASFHQLIGLDKTLPWLASTLRYGEAHFSKLAWIALLSVTPISLMLSVPAALGHLKLRRRHTVRV